MKPLSLEQMLEIQGGDCNRASWDGAAICAAGAAVTFFFPPAGAAAAGACFGAIASAWVGCR